MSLRTTGGVTFDDVRQAVQPRPDWNEDHDADGRERWSGPCPLAAPHSEVACRISGRDALAVDGGGQGLEAAVDLVRAQRDDAVGIGGRRRTYRTAVRT